MKSVSYLLACVSFALVLAACTGSSQNSAGASPSASASAQGSPVAEAASPAGTQAATEAASPAGSPGATVAYTDINGIFAQKAIDDEARLGVFETTSGEFKPNDPLTRGEFVKWLVSANNIYFYDQAGSQLRMPETAEVTFVDVPQSSPYWKYVQALVDAGFAVGVDPTHFAPDRQITRQEMVAIKYQVDVGHKATPDPSDNASNLSQFSDAKQVSPIYITLIKDDMYDGGTGVINRVWGKTAYLHPTRPVTRAEAAVALADIAGRNASEVTLPSPSTSP